jgi:hypothetical protein
MQKQRKPREKYGKIANLVRSWVGAVLDVKTRGTALDLDKEVIPVLREMMSKRYQKAVNRAFLLNCLTVRDSGFVLHFDGDNLSVQLARRQRRPLIRANQRNIVDFPRSKSA